MKNIIFPQNLYSDIRIENRFTTLIALKNGKPSQCKEVEEEKAFLRVFDGKTWYYCSTTSIDEIQKELDNLAKFATENPKIYEHPIVKAYEVNKEKVFQFENHNVRNTSIDTKTEFLSKLNEKINSKFITLKNAFYIDRNSRYEFYSSKGAEIEYDFQKAGFSVSVAFTSGEKSFNAPYSYSGISFEELSLDENKINEFVKECENFLLNAKPLEKAGNYPVILSPLATGIFAHESFGHKSEADFMLGDETMAKEWAIGKKVGSELLSIVDSGTNLGSGYVPFDDEGTKATKTYLIKNGVLSGRLHSVATSEALGEKPTGNARAISCEFEPIVRMTNTFVEGGESSFEDLVKGISHGYFIKTVNHGSGMSTFTLAPNICYEIKDGKIGDPVKIAVITGNVFKTLSLIDGVSKEVELLSFITGGCGKMEQSGLSVGFGGPYVRISQMGVQ